MVWVGSQYMSATTPTRTSRSPAYWIANLHTSYQINKEVQVFGLVNNVFNRKFAAYGTYFGPDGVQFVIPNPPTDPRTVTPGSPLAVLSRRQREAAVARISALRP